MPGVPHEMKKMWEEQPMAPDEVLALDEALDAQSGIGRIVHALRGHRR